MTRAVEQIDSYARWFAEHGDESAAIKEARPVTTAEIAVLEEARGVMPAGVKALWSTHGSFRLALGKYCEYEFLGPVAAEEHAGQLQAWIDGHDGLRAAIAEEDGLDVGKMLPIVYFNANYFVLAMQGAAPHAVYCWYHDEAGVFVNPYPSYEAFLENALARAKEGKAIL